MEKSFIYFFCFNGLVCFMVKELENGIFSILLKVNIIMNKMGIMIYCCVIGNSINDNFVSNILMVMFVSLE